MLTANCTIFPAAAAVAFAASGCGTGSQAAAPFDAGADAHAADAAARDATAGARDAGASAEAAASRSDGSMSPDATASSPDDGASSDAVADSPDDASFDGTPSPPMGPCGAVVQEHAVEGFAHVPICSHVTYDTKPPSSGNHYPIWAAYQSYSSAIPEGFWVHDLEHGAVVFSYNCPTGCAADIAAAQSFIDGLPPDPLCDPSAGDPPVRMVMTPDPTLDVRFAASSWGWTLRAACFDPAAFGAFVQARYGQGRESLCGQGDDLSSGVPPECGD